MFGHPMLVKCPYCGKIRFEREGTLDIYQYDDYRVIIEKCHNCDKQFLTTFNACPFNSERITPLGLVWDVFDFITKENPSVLQMDEDDAIKFVMNWLSDKHPVKSPSDIAEFKHVIQYVLANCTEPFSNRSWEYNEDIKNQLIYKGSRSC